VASAAGITTPATFTQYSTAAPDSMLYDDGGPAARGPRRS
jgi:hypothetical protein